MIVAVFCLAACAAGFFIPKRWAVLGFVGAAAGLFVLKALALAAFGFAGASIEESLLLFNGSWGAYLGFNIQVAYRAFAPVLLALALPLIFRLAR